MVYRPRMSPSFAHGLVAFPPMVLIFPFQSMFGLWKTHAGSLCSCTRRRVSSKLLQVHGMSSCIPFSSSVLSARNRIVVMSSPPSSFQSTAQMENRTPYAREITLDDSTSYVQSVEWLSEAVISPLAVSLHSPSTFLFPFLNCSAPLQTKNTTSNTSLAPFAPPYLAHKTLTTNTTATYTAISTTPPASLQNAPAAPAPSSNSLWK
jgi:hypothetical protein